MKSISRPPQQAGFALIITILLMAFLVLLMVSMASLTRVETQIALNSQTADKARQNALLALNIALGHLQKAAGPDQRITARADILDSSTTTLTNSNVKQPLWTGVWKTYNSANPTWNLDVDNNGVSGEWR
jgi:Tfp pilus assembly protein PilX